MQKFGLSVFSQTQINREEAKETVGELQNEAGLSNFELIVLERIIPFCPIHQTTRFAVSFDRLRDAQNTSHEKINNRARKRFDLITQRKPMNSSGNIHIKRQQEYDRTNER